MMRNIVAIMERQGILVLSMLKNMKYTKMDTDNNKNTVRQTAAYESLDSPTYHRWHYLDSWIKTKTQRISLK